MSSRRRRGSRSPVRNKLRQNSSSTDLSGKVKSGSKRKTVKKKRSEKITALSSRYKKRDSKDQKRAVERISEKINRRFESKGPMLNRLKEYAISESDSPLVGDGVESVLTLQSNELTAFQYTDGDRIKIVIEGLSKMDDNGFAIIDSINAITEGFGHKGLKKIDLYISTDNADEESNLEDYISLDNEILQRTTFIKRRSEEDDSADDLIDDFLEYRRDFAKEPPVSMVMDSAFLMSIMKEIPKEKSKKYKEVLDRLDDYHTTLDKFKDALFSELDATHTRKPETGDQSSQEISDDLGIIKAILIQFIKTYISDSRTLPHRAGAKKVKKGVMGSLQKQLESLSRRRYNELTDKVEYLNLDLEDIRGDVFLSVFNPLTENDINREIKSTYLGEGAGGKVNAVTFKGTPQFKAALKIDGLSNDEAANSGISRTNPEQSKRAVSAYVVSQLLDFDLIPDTRFFLQNNPDTGIPEVGHAMEVVSGQIGQLKGIPESYEATEEELRKIQQAEALIRAGQPRTMDVVPSDAFLKARQDFINAREYMVQFTLIEGKYLKDFITEAKKENLLDARRKMELGPPQKPLIMDDDALLQYQMDLRAFNGIAAYVREYDDEFRRIRHKPPSNIKLTDGVVQKSMSDLQIFDYIIGHADRHGENYIFETNDLDDVTGIKGIDNSDAFGENWTPKNADNPKSSKTPPIPPVIDLDRAIKILSFNKPSLIEATFKDNLGNNLSEAEIRAAFDRLTTLQKEMVDGIVNGEIKLATPSGNPKIAAIGDLQSALQDFDEHLDDRTIADSVIKWGGNEILARHTQENSYLGTAQSIAVDRGFQDPATAL